MVKVLLHLIEEPAGRLWIIGQPADVAARDAAHLLLRFLMLCVCTACA